jgi:hypothetical protein
MCWRRQRSRQAQGNQKLFHDHSLLSLRKRLFIIAGSFGGFAAFAAKLNCKMLVVRPLTFDPNRFRFRKRDRRMHL